MSVSSDSHKLITFYTTHLLSKTNGTDSWVAAPAFNSATKRFFHDMFQLFKDAGHYIDRLPIIRDTKPYILETSNNLHSVSPATFKLSDFPKKIKEHVCAKIQTVLTYTLVFMDKQLKVYFLTEQSKPSISRYETYLVRILTWIFVAHHFAPRSCVGNLKIFIYFTNLKKSLPKTALEIIGREHANTAFTYTCPKDPEIAIFRKEEWFKTFIHETFHTFHLDFSGMRNHLCEDRIKLLFGKIDSDVRLYEAYTECWARILNAMMVCYFELKQEIKLKRS